MITNYFKQLISSNIFNTSGMFSLPLEYHIGLSSTKPTVDGKNITEPDSLLGYKRVIVSNNSDTFSLNENKSTNKGIIYFPESLDVWESIKYVLIFDSSNHLLMSVELSEVLEIPKKTILYLDIHSLGINIR